MGNNCQPNIKPNGKSISIQMIIVPQDEFEKEKQDIIGKKLA
jgi:hypothetical protein